MHRRKRISAQRSSGARETGIMRSRRTRVRISRRRIEMVLIRSPERAVAVLLQLYEGAFRHRRRIARIVRRRRSEMGFPWHRRRARGILVWSPKRGTQVRKIQRREGFVIHFDEVWRRLEWIPKVVVTIFCASIRCSFVSRKSVTRFVARRYETRVQSSECLVTVVFCSGAKWCVVSISQVPKKRTECLK